MDLKFKLKKTCSCGGRRGEFETKWGVHQTPMFMPVGTQATVKTLSPEELIEAGSDVILSNTYHLWLRPGEDIVDFNGGLHKFMNYHHGPILTDCGGFQVFSLAKPKDISEEGVKFKSHIDGSNLFLTPEKSIDIQNKLHSDIIMSFDECPPYPATHEYMKNSVERTLRWMKRSLDAHKDRENQAIFGIVQGGEFEDLRRFSAEETVKLDFDGYSVGGVSVGEDAETKLRMIEYATPYLPKDKIRYLMGVGEPIDLIDGVIRGIDIFDCVLPTRLARHGNALTYDGRCNLRNAKHIKDLGPIEEGCDCYACKHYSKSYIRHLIVAGESFGQRLISIHNIIFLTHLMEEIREHIEKDDLLEFREEFVSRYTKNKSEK